MIIDNVDAEASLGGVSQLVFPCLVAHGDVLLPDTLSDFRKYWLHSFNGTHLTLKNGSNPRLRLRFLITSDGRFHAVAHVRIRRQAFRFIASLLDFTLAEYTLSPGVVLAAQELRQRLEEIHSPAEFRLARQLRSYLKKTDSPEFDCHAFREFWVSKCPRLSPEEAWGSNLLAEQC